MPFFIHMHQTNLFIFLICSEEEIYKLGMGIGELAKVLLVIRDER